MKWQISDQQWRLRIGEDELQRLRDGHSVISVSLLPDGGRLNCVLQLGVTSNATVTRDGDSWTFTLPTAAVEAHAQRLPCRDGLDFSLPVNTDTTLQLVFDVDVRDSVRHRGAGSRRH